MPISIYLADENIRADVELAVEHWLATADVHVYWRGEPVIGSFFRTMAAILKREVVPAAVRRTDMGVFQTQEAQNTATLAQGAGVVLQALQPTKDAVLRIGALLIVKRDWVVQVYQLTAAQQVALDHPSLLAVSPDEIISALKLTEPISQNGVLPSTAQPIGRGETAAAAGN